MQSARARSRRRPPAGAPSAVRRAGAARAARALCTAVACAVVVAGAAAGVGRVHTGPRAVAPPSGTASPVADGGWGDGEEDTSTEGTPPAAGAEGTVEPAETVAARVVDRGAQLTRAMREVSVADGARVSVAVLDPESGAGAGYGDGTFDTASVVKVDILAALLLRAQDADRELTAAEQAYAVAMIESSDNASASALWESIGGAPGLDAANGRLGLTGTRGGDGPLWGLTRTTAADQLVLLRQVFGDFGEDAALSPASQAYVRGLMERIAEGQRWGVSAAADGSQWALKNGWLPRSTTGLWDVNSIGRVTVDGHAYLVAVLSDGNATQETGISLVEAAARAAVDVLATGA